MIMWLVCDKLPCWSYIYICHINNFSTIMLVTTGTWLCWRLLMLRIARACCNQRYHLSYLLVLLLEVKLHEVKCKMCVIWFGSVFSWLCDLTLASHHAQLMIPFIYFGCNLCDMKSWFSMIMWVMVSHSIEACHN